MESFPWQLTEIDAGAMNQHPAWEIIESILGWHILDPSRCSQTLGDHASSATQILADTWSMIIHMLKGQWDQIRGTPCQGRKRDVVSFVTGIIRSSSSNGLLRVISGDTCPR